MSEWHIPSTTSTGMGGQAVKASRLNRHRYAGLNVYTNLSDRWWRRIVSAVVDIYKPYFENIVIIDTLKPVEIDLPSAVVLAYMAQEIRARKQTNEVIKDISIDVRGIDFGNIGAVVSIGRHIRLLQHGLIIARIDIDNKLIIQPTRNFVHDRILAKICRYVWENIDRVGNRVTLWDVDYYLARKFYVLSDIRALGYVNFLNEIVMRYPIYKVAIPNIDTKICRNRDIDLEIYGGKVRASKRIDVVTASVVASSEDGFVDIRRLKRPIRVVGTIIVEYEIKSNTLALESARFEGSIVVDGKEFDHPNVNEYGEICLGTLDIKNVPIDRDLCSTMADILESIASILSTPNIGSAFTIPSELLNLVESERETPGWAV